MFKVVLSTILRVDKRRLCLRFVATTVADAGFWTAGMGHSSVVDSLVKNVVSLLCLPVSGGSEQEEDEQEDELQDERMQIKLSPRTAVTRARTDCLARKRSLRRLRTGQGKTSTKGSFGRPALRTALSGVGVVSALVEERRVGTEEQKRTMMDECRPSVFDYCFLRDHPVGERERGSASWSAREMESVGWCDTCFAT